MAKRKKRISIYCEYCQISHTIEDLDVEQLDKGDIKVYCQMSGNEMWLKKEEKQTLVDYFNN